MIGQVQAMQGMKKVGQAANSGRRRAVGFVAAGLLAIAGLLTPLAAQEKSTGQPVGGAWPTDTKKEGSGTQVAGISLDAKQIDAVKSVSAYFNEFQNMQGSFVQTDPDRKKQRGKFFVKRPGRLKFEYNLPSKQVITSDGQYVAVQDTGAGTDDRYPLEQTPFRVLLKKDVDLLRDARILDVQESADLVIVTLQDKSPDAPGRIKLIMARAPQLELKEWVTTDAQGKDTHIEVANLNKSEDVDAGKFKIHAPNTVKPGGG